MAIAAIVVLVNHLTVASPIEDLDNATPAAAALIYSKVSDWRKAPAVVKERAAFMLFSKDFPRKREMSQNDMVACIDQGAATGSATTAVLAIFNQCAGL